MREVDRLMMEELQLGLLQMMENAGPSLASRRVDCSAATCSTRIAGCRTSFLAECCAQDLAGQLTRPESVRKRLTHAAAASSARRRPAYRTVFADVGYWADE
jgi:hypothetical protein